jgi:hypothetical protein
VRCLPAHVQGDAQGHLPSQPEGGLGRQELVGDEDVLFLRGLLFLPADLKVPVNARQDVGDVRLALPEVVVGQGFKELFVTAVGLRQRPLGAGLVVANDGLEAADEGRVLEDEEVGFENEGVLPAHLLPDASLDLDQVVPRPFEGLVEPLQLVRDLGFGDELLPRREDDPPRQQDLAHGDPRRNPGASQARYVHAGSLFLIEAVPDKLDEGGHGRLLVLARDQEPDRSPLGRGQGQDAEDALAVDLIAVLDDLHRRTEAVGQVDELDRGSGMEAQLVSDGDGPVEHTGVTWSWSSRGR